MTPVILPNYNPKISDCVPVQSPKCSQISAFSDSSKNTSKENVQRGLYEGMLFKKPTRLSAYLSWTGWRERYFVADDLALNYYYRKGDQTPRGRYFFHEDFRVVRLGLLEGQNVLFGMDIIYKGYRVSFASKSKNSIDLWADVLEFKVRRAAMKHNHSSENRISHSYDPEYERTPEEYLSSDETYSYGSHSEAKEQEDFLCDAGGGNEILDNNLNGLYGASIPKQFSLIHDSRMSSRKSSCFDGWKLLYTGTRVYERESATTGSGIADVNGQTDGVCDEVEMKCQASVSAPALHVLLMMMDLSDSRRSWDTSYDRGEIISVEDAHNDTVNIFLKPMIDFCVTASCKMNFLRYWCYEKDGSFIIYYRTPKAIEAGTRSNSVSASINFMHITIVPTVSRSMQKCAQKSCAVTFGFSAHMNGWATFFKLYARAQMLRIIRCVESLKSLAIDSRVKKWNKPNDKSDSRIKFAFDCLLKLSLSSEIENLEPFEVAEDPYFLVNVSRNIMGKHESSVTRDTAFQRDLQMTTAQKNKSSSTPSKDGLGTSHDTTTATGKATALHLTSSVEGGNSCEFESESSSDEDEVNLEHPSKFSSPVELCYEYSMPRNNYVLPMVISKDGVTAWSDSGAFEGCWNIRGPNYLTDKVKVRSKVSAMEIIQMQWSFFDAPKRNISRDSNELVQLQHEGRKDRPFLVVINFMVPTCGNWVLYIAKRRGIKNPVFDSMLEDFINKDDSFRNSRFKIIPTVVEGPWIAKKSIGTTPAILGKKIDTEYYRGENWLEICVDIGSSRIAVNLLGLVKASASSVVLDFAFLFESQKPAELPETIMCSVRAYQPLMYIVDDIKMWAKSEKAYEAAIRTPFDQNRKKKEDEDQLLSSVKKLMIK